MTEKKRCAKCERAIDAISTICPFCNWDQAQPAPSPEELAAPSRAAMLYKPPEEFPVRKMVLIGVGVLVMLIAAFGLGYVINSDGAPEKVPENLEQAAAEHNQENLKPRRADTPLIPAGQGGIDQAPITSAPVIVEQGATPNEYQRTDATAVSSVEYAEIAKRAQAEKAKNNPLVDPRTLSGAAYAQGGAPGAVQTTRRVAPLRPTPAPQASSNSTPSAPPQYSSAPSPSAPAPSSPAPSPTPSPTRHALRTKPIPEYQPLPSMRGTGVARLTLVVGTDGRVRDVNIEHSLAGGNTAALISSVQRWRFKPATENGEPVAAPYTVEIKFGRE